ncbi:Dihydroneopterin aldolase [Candidatus Gullanella endobia]|uniref:7,8-dihydroneopterin aldolase n=1 Tax=Candidatus Gullanella endobia TaxID=1070130 RepID=A0A143WRF7_9ENTR|nr:dihydroneopterin aldolase [Candidatus Gullanella endobia]CUX96263.1 Dihydroneopterin aldolase [Candidatus Gullanella endobia]
MDIIFIEQLTVMAIIGIYDWEKQKFQKLVFDLEIGWNKRPLPYSDDISDCLNYTDVTNAILSLVSSKRFALIECVAEETAEQLISQFKIPWVRIKLSKPSAVPQAINVGIIIERGKQKV